MLKLLAPGIRLTDFLTPVLVSDWLISKKSSSLKLLCQMNQNSALRKLNTERSIGASHQVSVHLAKQLQRRRFLEIDQSETRMACGGHVY
jgi:hypothetical protein